MSIAYLVPAWKKNSRYLDFALQSIRLYDSNSPIVVIGCGKSYVNSYEIICKLHRAILFEAFDIPIFSKSVMLNVAFVNAPITDSVVIYDADFIATQEIVDIWHKYSGQRVVSNFTQLRLDKDETNELVDALENVYTDGDNYKSVCRCLQLSMPSGGLYSYASTSPPVILPRYIYEEVGGFCEEIIGWGSEDSDFTWMLEKHGYRVRDNSDPRIRKCCVFHLWHGADKAGGYRLSKNVKMKRRERMQKGELVKGNEGEWGNLEVRKIV